MLVLTRKSEQKIVIGGNIVITVLKIQENQVSLGIAAPEETRIFRAELLEAIREENSKGMINQQNIDIKSVAGSLKT